MQTEHPNFYIEEINIDSDSIIELEAWLNISYEKSDQFTNYIYYVYWPPT